MAYLMKFWSDSPEISGKLFLLFFLERRRTNGSIRILEEGDEDYEGEKTKWKGQRSSEREEIPTI